MSTDEDSTQNWLLGGLLTVLLGGGLIVSVLLSIVLAPLAPYFAYDSGGGGGVCSAASTGMSTGTTRFSTGYRSAVSPASPLATRVSTASLSLRDRFAPDGAIGNLLRRRARSAI